MTTPMPEPQDIAALREDGESVAPWLVVLSQHMPEVHHIGRGDVILGCSCDATRSLYVGHLARVLADRSADMAAEVERGRALRAAVEALAEEWEADEEPPSEDYEGTTEGHWAFGEHLATRRCGKALTALLAAHVPSPLLDGGAGEGDR